MLILGQQDVSYCGSDFDATNFFFIEIHITDFVIIVTNLFDEFHSMSKKFFVLGVIFSNFILFQILSIPSSEVDFLHIGQVVNSLEKISFTNWILHY